MKKYFSLFLLIFLFSCQKKEKSQEINILFKADIQHLIQDVDQLQTAIVTNQSPLKLQSQFLKTHQNYKGIEMLTEYYFPSVAKAVNGPAIPEFEENDGKVIAPEGFQVIEELLFPVYEKQSKDELLKQIGILNANLKRIQKTAATNTLTDAHVFDAMRLEVFRIMTLGITGFDSPIAKNSIAEAIPALQSIQKYFKVYAENKKDRTATLVLKTIEDGIKSLKRNTDFDSFDRASFILNTANPLSRSLYQAQMKLGIPVFKEVRGLRTTAQTLFDKEVFDPEAFSGFPDYKTTPEKIALGKLLFKDPVLSGDNSRSCASCHHADKAFTDGMEKAVSFDGNAFVERNTPTLKNIAFQRAFFADSKVNYLEDQAVAVITNKQEMHGDMEAAALKIKTNKDYVARFKNAFPANGINAFAIKNALGSYIRSLSNYDSKFDRYMRGELTFTADEKAGFNLFSGKAKCASCHFIPLINGTVPPHFDRSESEVLGVPNKNNVLDVDLGKYAITKAAIHKYSFKTPTIRNVELTAPYMHNGVFKTLEEVIDFYNEAGGEGLGFKLDNQTLPTDKLNLTSLEKKQLTVFMRTLTDLIREK
ncbi:cytochrome-c peroxidase [Flavobacterium sp. K5-23]|uniref:cytochrome-c peroxidase n=1 Tax=Flavobacterium sp. K5-23 TaxID=2746225 RepID=UPI002010417F|nr:cytochrome c peroxidase [Flavobacterium sp. K5-23]UQD57632.1 cytochrome-c peroxidase [Flavobacterium sp. K5-23]